MPLPQFVVAETQPRHCVWAVVLKKHVGAVEQSFEDPLPVFSLEIERYPALVPVDHEERRGFARDGVAVFA